MTARPLAGGAPGPVWTAPGVQVNRCAGPNPLWASNGVAFGPDGRLWIAQFLGGTVGALDVTTGGIETVLGPDGPLTAPDDIAFADDGTLFVVDLPAGLVWRRATRAGALAAMAAGTVATLATMLALGDLYANEPVFAGIGSGLVAFVVVSLLTRPTGDDVRAEWDRRSGRSADPVSPDAGPLRHRPG